ncbi:MAG TPA: hypothetical protein VJ508_16960, partial [Saprospiraceae bacterium]|nr:hypothetical protein [Saprospiraceae bacterium]
ILTCMLAFAGGAQAMMGSDATGMTGGSTGTMGTFMQMPTGQQLFEYGGTTDPVMGTDISTIMPIGVGTVAMGGNMITVHAAIGQFTNPMDMYLTVYAPAIDPFDVFVMHPDGNFWPVSAGFEPWMAGVNTLDQTPITDMPTSDLPKGTYTVGLMATPTGGNMSTYYMWTTHFVVQ